MELGLPAAATSGFEREVLSFHDSFLVVFAVIILTMDSLSRRIIRLATRLARCVGGLFLVRTDSKFLLAQSGTYEGFVETVGPNHWQVRADALPLEPDQLTLDLGCGPGQWLPPLSRRSRATLGIDIDPVLLNGARLRARDSPAAWLARAAAEAIPVRDSTIHLVLCYSVFHYTDHHSTLKEVHRVLRDGGYLVIGIPGLGYYLKHIVEGIRCRSDRAITYGLEPFLCLAGEVVLGRRVRSTTPWSQHRMRRVLGKFGFRDISFQPDKKSPAWPDSFGGASFYYLVTARKM